MADTRKPFALRLDPLLHSAVERAAATDLRSVNAEIECLLREALARRGREVQTTTHTQTRPAPKR